jgi:3-hydroxyisobutyrate dehydrogenase-like beta-hydroxyacid dehydrogenase
MMSSLPGALKADLERHTRAIIDNDFSEVQASIRTWKEALDRVLEEGQTSKINVDLLNGVNQMLAQGVKQGVGEEDIAALTKIMS